MMDVLELLKNLVEIRSPSGKEDRLIAYLTDVFESLGYEPHILEGKGVKDIVLNPKAEVWVITHLDTVPIKREFEFDGKYAYGTGVCDTKGSIAAILLALEEIEELNFGIALLSDEEEGGRGSEIFVEAFEPKMAIVMEPTSLKIAKVHYGSLEVMLKFKGEPAHGSTPEFGRNAIDLAIDAIVKLRGVIRSPVKFLVQQIEGGWEEYAVPESCKVRLDFVFPPEVEPEDIEGILSDLGGCYEVIEKSRGFVSGNVVELLEDAIRMAGMDIAYGIMPSWTDAINLRSAGWDVVVFGPGELQYCHTPKERIDPNEILKAKDVLKALNSILQGRTI